MNIPPKYSKVFTVDSTASDPHLCGPLEVRLSHAGVSIRWAGETVWKEIDWYEIAVCAESPGMYRELLDDLKVQAFEEGLEAGVRTACKETDVLNYREELESMRENPLPSTSKPNGPRPKRPA